MINWNPADQVIDPPNISSQDLFRLVSRLYPLCRSITGDGVWQTLKILQEYIPVEIHEVATGTQVFDWTVPKEWNIRDAYIKNPEGRKIVDFQACNLHVVNYSAPIKKKVPLEILKAHCFTLPQHPQWVPYRTSYYKEDWGFCLSHQQLQELADGEYEVSIDSSLKEGHLTYGECFLPGSTDDEILISVHVCHPSLANDNLSSIAVATSLYQQLSRLSSTIFLQVPVYSGNDRFNYLVKSERESSFKDPARPGAGLCWRRWQYHI